MKLVLLSIVVLAAVTSSCCGRQLDSIPDYTHTTDIQQVGYYEVERLKEAEMSPVITLKDLGYEDILLPGSDGANSPVIEYELPANATQGPDTWYVFNLHFLIEFDESTGAGYGSVGADGPGAGINFETLRVDKSPYIRMGNESSSSLRIEVRYVNYMMLRSVKPGLNEIIFQLHQKQGTKVRSLLVYRDSGIASTTTAPSEYEEGLKLSQQEQKKARETAFTDPRVRELAEGKEYALRIVRADGMVRPADEPPDDDIEVRLVFDGTYLIDGVEASALVIIVDPEKNIVTVLYPVGTDKMFELTESEREQALSLALEDSRIQAQLDGKEYTIGYIGVSIGGPVGRRGANIRFDFSEPGTFEQEGTFGMNRQQTGVTAFINLEEGRVVDVFEETSFIE